MFDTFRNFLSEFRLTQTLESALHNLKKSQPASKLETDESTALRLHLRKERDYDLEAQQLKQARSTFDAITSGYRKRNEYPGSSHPFEFYEAPNPEKAHLFNPNRLPAPGITSLPFRYHKSFARDQFHESVFQTHETLTVPLDDTLIPILYGYFPTYVHHVNALCRPIENSSAVFDDFNRPQIQYPEIEKSLTLRIVNLIFILMNALPFLPLHYVDVFFTKMPLSTGIDYFHRHSYEHRAHAHFSHPEEYATKPTSKGYFLNTFTLWARTAVHRIKETSFPFTIDNLSPSERLTHLRSFFMQHACMLSVRSMISKATGPFKLRPVYMVDFLFLVLECMITFPLHVMARSVNSCVMYSYETIRGGCSRIDALAQRYSTYLCIDWSSFDQRVPFIIVDTFFTVFLPALLVISHGYQPTAEYPVYPDLSPTDMFNRLFNIIIFLRTWYYNTVFVNLDGYAYVRRFAGIMSGLLNTQYLDSYCNLFIMLHALMHFGCSDDEIMQIMFFVLGDDNILLTHWPELRLHSFMRFLESHALTRFGMVLSPTKSILTSLRSRIEMLGYRCNFGYPRRPIDKLVAQLVYPEHGFKPQFQSDRAIGIAYAAAGQDREFHSFCKMIHDAYLKYRNPDTKASRQTYLPGYLRQFDDDTLNIMLDRFPSQSEVSARYSQWQGELPQDKKWNPAHFIRQPSFYDPNMQTMSDYMFQNNIEFPSAPDLFAEYHTR